MRSCGTEISEFSDIVSVEEPLEIRICYGHQNARVRKNISVTMRTPGADSELAIGFLFTEGIISAFHDVNDVYHVGTDCVSQKNNIVQVELQEGFLPQLTTVDRNFYTTSSCGVCGKGSIQSIRIVSPFHGLARPRLSIATDMLCQLPKRLKTVQSDFAATGGIHASSLFNLQGDLVLVREDVGRHNALDKLVGAALADNALPMNQHVLLLSGRASFELVQKAAMAGISIVAAIGAPSSLAVDMAKEFDMTLIGFLKADRFNIYHLSSYTVIAT